MQRASIVEIQLFRAIEFLYGIEKSLAQMKHTLTGSIISRSILHQMRSTLSVVWAKIAGILGRR